MDISRFGRKMNHQRKDESSTHGISIYNDLKTPATRDDALMAVRSEIRKVMGRHPADYTGKDAYEVLDEVGRKAGDVKHYLAGATDKELGGFIHSWDKWRKNHIRETGYVPKPLATKEDR